MKLNRTIVKLSQLKTNHDDDYVAESMANRIEMVWDITHELWGISTKGSVNAQSRLQRNVTSIKQI